MQAVRRLLQRQAICRRALRWHWWRTCAPTKRSRLARRRVAPGAPSPGQRPSPTRHRPSVAQSSQQSVLPPLPLAALVSLLFREESACCQCLPCMPHSIHFITPVDALCLLSMRAKMLEIVCGAALNLMCACAGMVAAQRSQRDQGATRERRQA